jgi:hypothetical protein
MMDYFKVADIIDILEMEDSVKDVYEKHIRQLMNQHFALVTGSGRVRVAEVMFKDGRPDQVLVRDMTNFKLAYMNLIHIPTRRSFVNMWLKDPYRRIENGTECLLLGKNNP